MIHSTYEPAVDLLIREHEQYPNNPYLFPSPITGEMYYPDSVAKLHEKILKDAGLERIRFHGLRHTFATLALQNGVDIKTVSSMLGHYDAGFTLRTYTHATCQMQDQAAETMGELHDPDDVAPSQNHQNTGQEGQTSCPVLSKPFRTFPVWGSAWVKALMHWFMRKSNFLSNHRIGKTNTGKIVCAYWEFCSEGLSGGLLCRTIQSRISSYFAKPLAISRPNFISSF